LIAVTGPQSSNHSAASAQANRARTITADEPEPINTAYRASDS
jgi:hypothetical protein